MRTNKFFITSIALAMFVGGIAPTYAGDNQRRHHNNNGAIAFGIIAGAAIIAGAIANNRQQQPQYGGGWMNQQLPQYGNGWTNQLQNYNGWTNQRQLRADSNRPTYGLWVDKWQYEQSGQACPGPIDYWDGIWWCRIR